ncbi:MAG: hypothetical protein CMI16_02900 [Opitutaceae bacterium]|nr:hypothetical protein [Opitutaceae bacterium]
MCVNWQVSLLAFVVAEAACLALWVRNRPHHDRWVSLFSGYIGLMQLLEFLMWRDQACGAVNVAATQLAFVQNLLQPVVACVVAWWHCENGLAWYSMCLFVVWVGVYVPAQLSQWDAEACTLACGDPDSRSGLAFPYTDFERIPGSTPRAVAVWWALFAATLCSPFLHGRHTALYCWLGIGTWLLGYGISVARPCHRGPTAGSWWCLLATLVPCVACVKRGALVHLPSPAVPYHQLRTSARAAYAEAEREAAGELELAGRQKV